MTDTDICRSANHTDTASDTRLTHLLRRPFGFILTITHSMHHSFYYNWSVFKELLQYLSDFICIRYDLSLWSYEGLPFRYISRYKILVGAFLWRVDARVLAEQQIWVAVMDGAKNQAFNCTIGDVFTWKSLWKVLCEVFDVDFVSFDENEKFDWIGMMKEKGRCGMRLLKSMVSLRPTWRRLFLLRQSMLFCILVFNLLVAWTRVLSLDFWDMPIHWRVLVCGWGDIDAWK